MIERYTRPEMGALWHEDAKFHFWLEVELAHLEVLEERGDVPAGTARTIRDGARIDPGRVLEIEATVNHDVIAFITSITENLGDEGRFMHRGMTSSDLLDTATGMRLVRTWQLLRVEIDRLHTALRTLALDERHTLMIGRTHGVHAEPTTFGLKVLVWYEEVGRARARLERAFAECAVGKMSGAVGTFAHLEPAVEEAIMARLGLGVEPVATQVVQRDRHAALLTTIAVLGGTMEKIATEVRNLQRTDLLEVEESFGRGQRGSSAMPHKRNPIHAERVAGLSRVLRGNALASLENQALWHERDLTHSSVERVIFGDTFILVDYMLAMLSSIIEGLLVHRDNMQRNLERTQGLIFSQRVLLALVDAGMSRDAAYDVVQRNAMAVWRGEGDFRGLCEVDPDLARHLSSADLDELFDPTYFVRHTDQVFSRVLDGVREEALS